MNFRLTVIDNDLIAAGEGDQEAFSRLFYTYKDKVYTVAMKLTESQVMADEVVQEVFLRLWVKRSKLLHIQDFEGYLFVVTRNYVFSALKKIALQYKTESLWEDLRPVSENITESSLIAAEYETVLRQAIDLLSPQQKQVFLLSREKDLKREEIAAILNVSPETVKTHLSRALRHIRTYCSTQLGMELPIAFLIIANLR